MRGEPLQREDAARLWMGTTQNPSVVTALLTLDRAIPEHELLALIRTRVIRHQRFRQRIDVPRLPLRRPRWRDDDRGAPERHVVRMQLGPGEPERALRELVSHLASVPLDPRRHTWRMWHIDGVADGAALVVRVHHAVADGLALVGVLLGLSDEGAGVVLPPRTRAPASLPASGSVRARARAFAELLLRPPDAPPTLRGRLGGTKRIAWSRPIALEAFRRAAHAVNAHVNDLVLGALAGALRRWLERRHELPSGPIHALVPIALPHEPGALGNRFSSVFTELPVHVEDPITRIEAARVGMVVARATAGLSLGRTLVDLAPALGRHVENVGVRLVARKASLVASNVAGPQQPLHIGGRQVTGVVFAAPCPGSVALSANAMSYAGALRLTIASDARVIADPCELVEAFEDEVERVMDRLR